MQQSRDYCVLAYSTWHIVLSEIKLQVTIHESLHYLSNTLFHGHYIGDEENGAIDLVEEKLW